MDKQLFYWVTPETRTFMERGYLDEGQSVEERVREIAERAEEILKMEGLPMSSSIVCLRAGSAYRHLYG